eukprot:SAG11_NODE_4536_length_1860_cov_4.594549_1_plen_55_part_10
MRGILAQMSFGNEGWHLDDKACKMLNGWNSRCVAIITRRTPHEEASPRTRTTGIV